MNKKQRILVVIAIILITGTIGALMGYFYADSLKNPLFRRDFNKDFDGNYSKPAPEEFKDEIDKARENFDSYITIKSAVTMINIVIAVILIGMYIKIYRQVKSDFTIGLIVVMFALLLYAIFSNPFIQYLFTYRSFGQGPFILLPDIFTTIAVSVLLYLSLK
jgi:beta-lactamase regulating signal transducer with metallopeptidase domain